MLTPVAMAIRKESKNEEGSGCNSSSMDTALQAATRMTEKWCFLLHVPANFTADICGRFQGRHLVNIYMEKGAHLSPSVLSGLGVGCSYLKPWVG